MVEGIIRRENINGDLGKGERDYSSSFQPLGQKSEKKKKRVIRLGRVRDSTYYTQDNAYRDPNFSSTST